MFKNITKRDVKFFLLGILFLFLMQTILNFSQVKSDIIRGYQDGYNAGLNGSK